MPLKKLIAGLCCAIALSGCANIPIIKRTADYVQDKIYKRIPYTVDGDHRVIEIFFATDRQTDERSGELYFKRDIADSLTCGTLKARIRPGLKMGHVLPKRLKRRGSIGVQEVVKLSDDEFIKQLSEAVDKSPHKSLLVLIYGFKDNFELTATKAAFFAYMLDVNTPVLLFDWPGDQSVAPWGYMKARKLAEDSGPYLGEVLAKVIRQVKPAKLWIESSSLGCQVTCSAFEWMCRHPDLADPDAEITHVALAAPDVGDDEFNDRFKGEITALTAKLTTYVSSNDSALMMSQIIDGEKKFGRQSVKNHEQLEEAKDMLYLKSLAPDKVEVIDVTLIDRASYGHGYDLESAEFYDDFYLRIFEAPPHTNRRLYLVDVKDGADYWILKGD